MADYPQCNLLIAGETLTGSGRESHDVIDPATGETIGSVPLATPPTSTARSRRRSAASRSGATPRPTSAPRCSSRPRA